MKVRSILIMIILIMYDKENIVTSQLFELMNPDSVEFAANNDPQVFSINLDNIKNIAIGSNSQSYKISNIGLRNNQIFVLSKECEEQNFIIKNLYDQDASKTFKSTDISLKTSFYGGSIVEGNKSSDDFSFSFPNNQIKQNLNFQLVTKLTNYYYDSVLFIGLGLYKNNSDSIVYQFYTNKIIKSQVVGINGNNIILGGVDTSIFKASSKNISYVIPSDIDFWGFNIYNITVNETSLNITNRQLSIDLNSNPLIIPLDDYLVLKNKIFPGGYKDEYKCQYQTIGPYVQCECPNKNPDFYPSITFALDPTSNSSISVNPSDYIQFPLSASSTCYLLFSITFSNKLEWTIGINQLANYYYIFDYEKMEIKSQEISASVSKTPGTDLSLTMTTTFFIIAGILMIITLFFIILFCIFKRRSRIADPNRVPLSN